jgi:hypothetical protein
MKKMTLFAASLCAALLIPSLVGFGGSDDPSEDGQVFGKGTVGPREEERFLREDLKQSQQSVEAMRTELKALRAEAAVARADGVVKRLNEVLDRPADPGPATAPADDDAPIDEVRLRNETLREALDCSREALESMRIGLKDLRAGVPGGDGLDKSLVQHLDRIHDTLLANAPPVLRARIEFVEPPSTPVPYALISVGSNRGAEEGARFHVIDADGHDLGTITLVAADANRSTGRLNRPGLARIHKGLEARGYAKRGFKNWVDAEVEEPGFRDWVNSITPTSRP